MTYFWFCLSTSIHCTAVRLITWPARVQKGTCLRSFRRCIPEKSGKCRNDSVRSTRRLQWTSPPLSMRWRLRGHSVSLILLVVFWSHLKKWSNSCNVSVTSYKVMVKFPSSSSWSSSGLFILTGWNPFVFQYSSAAAVLWISSEMACPMASGRLCALTSVTWMWFRGLSQTIETWCRSNSARRHPCHPRHPLQYGPCHQALSISTTAYCSIFAACRWVLRLITEIGFCSFSSVLHPSTVMGRGTDGGSVAGG